MFVAAADNDMQMDISFEISNAIIENQFSVLILTFNIMNFMFCSNVPQPVWDFLASPTHFRPLQFSSDKYCVAIFLNEIISHTLSQTIYHIGF